MFPGCTPSKSLPLVVAMHMFPGTGTAVAELSGLNKKADAKNFLVAYPDGFSGGCNALTCCGAEDDIGFLKTMVGRLTTTWKADPSRVYATGISNGGDMSFKVGVELHDLFAAVASVSGAFAGPAPATPSYAPKSPVSMVTFIYRLPDMGHSWPGASSGAMADPEAGLNATDLMWDFFSVHPKKRA
ncbi:alpha/beta hydrolase family esterase [Streptomyces sp. NPDC087440]|uniref:alpha/beta hydrolase family esterase n=1 Tax=Streptomyces sp. NPDC087440 TaxID=3365790 RepID=UPI00383095AC